MDEQLKTINPSWTIPAKSVLTIEVQAPAP